MPCKIIGKMKGKKGNDGKNGTDGISIRSIQLINTSGLSKNYRITLTNGTTFDYTIRDGVDGVDAETETPTSILNKLAVIDGAGSGLDADLLDGLDSSYYAKKEELDNLSNVLHAQLHSRWHLYKNMQVVSLHIVDWTVNTNVRDSYADTHLKLPEGFAPPQTVFVDDVVVENQHIVVGADGNINVFVPSTNNGETFNGQASWITYE